MAKLIKFDFTKATMKRTREVIESPLMYKVEEMKVEARLMCMMNLLKGGLINGRRQQMINSNQFV